MPDRHAPFVDALTLEHAWALVEHFSVTPRWRPEDVNTAMDHLVGKLQALGVPIDVYEPELCLSVPLDASVEAGGERFRAKPPSNAMSAPEGVEAPLVYIPADKSNLRSYSKNIRDLFGDAVVSEAEARDLLMGKILITEGFGNPALTQFAEEWGAVGLIAVNPGVDIHWGTCTTIWGSPDLDDLPRKPTIPVGAVNAPDGGKLIALAQAGGAARLRTEMQEGWFPQKIPVVTIPGSAEPDRFVLVHGHLDSWDVGVGDNATGDAVLLELARVLWDKLADLRR
ncbi:MAG: M28 family peptidase, partial [Pseudomonadota bacterium]